MTRAFALLAALAAAASLAPAWQRPTAAAPATGAPGVGPVVLELFQSQGCSSCPPALDVLREEADRPDVIALSFAVTYWDELGWKDSFAQPAFTSRQWDYAHANDRATVATPQLIVNGRGFVNGGDKGELESAIRRYPIGRTGPGLSVRDGRLLIGSARAAQEATVWLVSFDPRTLQVPIRAGENGGRTLPHRNIVRSIDKLGGWAGSERSYPLPPARPGLDRAILVQEGTGGPIIAARRFG